MTAARAFLLLVVLQLIGCGSPPDDQVLIDRFTRDRESFERLVQLVAEEQSRVKWVPSGAYSFDENDSTKAMRRIMKPDPNQEPDPRDENARPEKQALMETLHIKSMNPRHDGVSFYYTGIANDLYGYNKGWEFMAEGAHHPDSTMVVGSLDGIEGQVEPYGIRYRSLGDGWYLFLQSTSD